MTRSEALDLALSGRRSQIRDRLVLLFTVLLVGAMGITMAVLLMHRISAASTRLVDETCVRATNLAVKVAPSLEFGEPREAQTLLDHFVDDPRVRGALITDAKGSPFVEFRDIKRPDEMPVGSRTFIDAEHLWVSVPVIADLDVVGMLTLRISRSEMRGEMQRTILINIFVGLGVVGLTVLLLMKAVNKIIDPVSCLAGTVAKIGTEGDYSLRAVIHADDEIGALAHDFNLMLDTIEAQSATLHEQHEQLARSERLESLGQLAGGVAHDLNNILGPLVCMPEVILSELPEDTPVREDVEMMGKAAEQASVVIRDLLSLARRRVYSLKAVDINAMIQECVESPAVTLRLDEAPGVRCVLDLQDSAPLISGSEPHLIQAVLNLTINAIEAMACTSAVGDLTIKTSRAVLALPLDAYETIPAGEYVVLEVRDDGPGLSNEGVKRIFEPFYTNKKMGATTSGLGLSVVYGVVHDHGGYLDVISTPGEGAVFKLYLKRHVSDIAPVVVEGPENDEDASDEIRVLVVDDYAPQRMLTEKLLKNMGHRAQTSCSGSSAIALLKEDPAFDVMVVDMIMEEGFDGLDTIRSALDLNPDLRCIVATGFSETERVEAAIELGCGICLSKPFTREALESAVEEALEDDLVLAN